MSKGNIYLHIIEDDKRNQVLIKILVSVVPRVGDDIRTGGEGNEKFYTVTHVVWVYDEYDSPYERVNVGVTPVA